MDQREQQDLINNRAKIKLERDLGPDFLSALHDPRTIELMLNADGRLWQERLGEPMRCFGAMEAGLAQSSPYTPTVDARIAPQAGGEAGCGNQRRK